MAVHRHFPLEKRASTASVRTSYEVLPLDLGCQTTRNRRSSVHGENRFEIGIAETERRASAGGIPEPGRRGSANNARLTVWRFDGRAQTSAKAPPRRRVEVAGLAECRLPSVPSGLANVVSSLPGVPSGPASDPGEDAALGRRLRTHTETRRVPSGRAAGRRGDDNSGRSRRESPARRLAKSGSEKSRNGVGVDVGVGWRRQAASSCRLSRNEGSIGTDDYYLRRMKAVLYESKPAGARPSPTMIVDDYLYMGSCWDANNAPYLHRLGIDHVLNCAAAARTTGRPGLGPYRVDAGVVRYLGIPAVDEQSYDISRHVAETNAFIRQAKLSGGKVLVHCVMGINRSGFVVAAYLIGVLKMPLLTAVRLLKEQRRTVLFNTGFQRQLVWYARRKGQL